MRPLGVQISRMLKARGVDVIFGIPGVHNQELYRGIEEAGLRHVLPRHEQGAGFMADGYARATGRPGVCYVITGPGLTNIMTPMGQAYSDSVPMLVISACLDPKDRGMGKGKLHEMKDQEAAAATVCDWSQTAYDAANAYYLIDRALIEFSSKRPRPKHIQIPISVLEADAIQFDDWVPPAKTALPPQQSDVIECAKLLKKARHPIMVFGSGAIPSKETAGQVLQMTNAASFTTYAGRGIVTDNALHFGSYLANPHSKEIFAMADLVITIGTELAEVDLWRSHLGHSCLTIHVDTEHAILARGQGGDIRVLSDSGTFMKALSAELRDHTPDTEWTPAKIREERTRWRAETDAEHPGILTICDALKAALPETTRIFSDMTQFAYVAKEVWDMKHPDLWHHPFGFGTLGYALPAAIGGKVCLPDQPVIAIAGDYGFQYTIQELATAVELGLSLPILLWDNSKLGEIELSMERAQIAPNAVTLQNPDFLALARAYGAKAVEPTNLDALKEAVAEALIAPCPTVIRMTPQLGKTAAS